MNELERLMLIEAIRVTGNSVKFPVVGNWGHLQDELEVLREEGFLSFDGQEYTISEDGKKAILLFNAERADILSELEVYKEVNVRGKIIDARMPIVAYQSRKYNPARQQPHLEAVATMILWDNYFKSIKEFSENVVWQKVLFSSFKRLVEQQANRLCWRSLGNTIDDATMTAERLIRPLPAKSLVHITRN